MVARKGIPHRDTSAPPWRLPVCRALRVSRLARATRLSRVRRRSLAAVIDHLDLGCGQKTAVFSSSGATDQSDSLLAAYNLPHVESGNRSLELRRLRLRSGDEADC